MWMLAKWFDSSSRSVLCCCVNGNKWLRLNFTVHLHTEAMYGFSPHPTILELTFIAFLGSASSVLYLLHTMISRTDQCFGGKIWPRIMIPLSLQQNYVSFCFHPPISVSYCKPIDHLSSVFFFFRSFVSLLPSRSLGLFYLRYIDFPSSKQDTIFYFLPHLSRPCPYLQSLLVCLWLLFPSQKYNIKHSLRSTSSCRYFLNLDLLQIQ